MVRHVRGPGGVFVGFADSSDVKVRRSAGHRSSYLSKAELVFAGIKHSQVQSRKEIVKVEGGEDD